MKRLLDHGVSDESTRQIAGLTGAGLFGAASIMELVRMVVLKVPWPGFNSKVTWVLGGISVVLWLASAYVLARRTHRYRGLAIGGAFALFVYGILGTVGRSSFGMVYIAFALAMALLERLAFRGKLPIGYRVSEAIRPSSGREVV